MNDRDPESAAADAAGAAPVMLPCGANLTVDGEAATVGDAAADTAKAVEGRVQAESAAELFSEAVSRMRGNADERFTMNSYAKGLAAMLQDSSLPVPLLMGVHGKYGSGKTQLIKAVLWKVRRVCGFSCSNLGRPVTETPVRWVYDFCCCRTSFFAYLLTLAVISCLAAVGVMSFMIWAAVVYHDSVQGGGQGGNASSVNATTTTTPAAEALSNDVLYPLFAASAFMGAGLVVMLAAVVVYYCHTHLSPSSSAGPSRWQQLKLVLVMLFCETPPAPAVRKHDKVEVIPVVFDAWEYAGCDVLWAGIIKNIFRQVEDVFGKWKLRFYRTFRKTDLSHQHDLSVTQFEATKDINAYFGDSLTSRTETVVDVEALSQLQQQQQHSRSAKPRAKTVAVHTAKWMHVPYPILVLTVVSTIVVSVLVIVLFAAASNQRELAIVEQYIQLAAGVLLGLTALSQLSNLWALLQSAWSSQSNQLETAIQRLKGPDLASDLGFMHTVKTEVQRITGFVKLMERLYQKKFRILIVIDDLDKCEASRVASIFEAISILLSDEDSLFVTLIAIDRNTVSRAVGSGGGGEAGDGAEYLRRVVQMRFCIPEWTAADMEAVLDRSSYRRERCERPEERRRTRGRVAQGSGKKFSEPSDAVDGPPEALELMASGRHPAAEEALRGKLRRRMTKLAAQELKRHIDMLPTSYRNVQHLCNMVFFTVYLWVDKVSIGDESLESLERALADMCTKLTWWVMMTEEWPYRCSWMLKHIDAADELALKLSHGLVGDDSTNRQQLLSDVYKHVRERVKETEDWKRWISYDSSPEHFDLALDACPLTVQEVKYFLPFTINLDRAILFAIEEHCKMSEDEPCPQCTAASTPLIGRSRAQTLSGRGQTAAAASSCASRS